MKCEQVERVLSSSMDDPVAPPMPEAVQAHAESCPRCRAFARGAWRIRKVARFETALPVPDLAPAILERIAAEAAPGAELLPGSRRSPRRRPLHRAVRRVVAGHPAHPLRRVVAAGIAAGLLAGFVLTGGLLPRRGSDTSALASEIPQHLVAAAENLRGYRATFDVLERHWAPAVPRRTFVARVAFRAPEGFLVRVHDTTAYPSGSWTRNDLTLVTDGRFWAASGTEPCPDGVPPPCPVGPPVLQRVVNRPPFDQSTPMPTDVIVPMTVLAAADRVHVLGSGRADGRPAVAVGVRYQDATPLFSYLRFLGSWRPFFPQDRVVVWLDRATWFPLSYAVYPAGGPERARWAGQVGLGREPSGRPVFRATVRRFTEHVPPERTFSPRAARRPGVVARPSVLDEGFVDLPLQGVGRGIAPPVPRFTGGLRLVRFGQLPRTEVRPYRETTAAYANGLAWLTISRVLHWAEARPFGVGPFAQPIELPGRGPALYEPATSTSARRVSLHTPSGEILVSTNLPFDALRRVASSLPLRAIPAPRAWRVHPWSGGVVEDDLSPAAALHRAGFRALTPSWLPSGYRASAAELVRTPRVRGVTVAYRRPAAELDGIGLRLYQAAGQALPPPAGDEQAVAVAGMLGRWSPTDHELEWVSRGVYHSLTAPSFELSTALRIAASLRPFGAR
jgi:hypothetical protein